MDPATGHIPIVCDMSTATDTEAERTAEFKRLFTRQLTGRERTAEGIRFRFRDDDGVEEWVRDLADREKECCAFFTFTVSSDGGEVLLDTSVVDDETARAILEEFYHLPDLVDEDPEVVEGRFTRHGLRIIPAPHDC